MKHKSIALLLTILLTASLTAQTRGTLQHDTGFIPSGHRGAVRVLVYDSKNTILSAGVDGFLETWDLKKNVAVDRFQLSAYEITNMVINPLRPEIAVSESDNMGLYRLSAWNYQTKRNLFTLRFSDPISYISYSAGGTYLIVARSSRTGVVLIDPQTGELRDSPESLTGQVVFAATGRSDKTMLSYLASGVLSYWDLSSGTEIRHFTVPSSLTSPVLFGANNFIAAFAPRNAGLLILDAVEGTVIAQTTRIRDGLLLPINPTANEFLCLNSDRQGSILSSIELARNGELTVKSQVSISTDFTISAAVSAGKSLVLGTDSGTIYSVTGNDMTGPFVVKEQQQILEGTAGGGLLAFLTKDLRFGSIPLDFSFLEEGAPIELGPKDHYTHISAALNQADISGGEFLLWQGTNRQYFPLIRNINLSTDIDREILLDKLPIRYPIRSAAMLENKVLILDIAGNITVMDASNNRILFSYLSVGALDAIFLSDNMIIISRSTENGNTPFLLVNTTTSETVPLSYPASVGTRVFQSADGIVYGVVINQGVSEIIRLSLSNSRTSTKLIEYQGEDTTFTLSQLGGNLAFSLGGNGPSLYSGTDLIPFERSSGISNIVFSGKAHFIAIDTEGTICWHNPKTGKLEAMLRLYPEQWVLETIKSKPIRGRIVLSN
ncbi:WD40 repeat domain-containing protein [Breznakiellaceae bacterium SP9]